VPSVVFSPAARAELIEARDWYAARNEELADRFIAEIENLVARIAARPRQFPVVHGDVPRARFRRFPYALFFRIVGGTLQVIACFHGKRDPRQWQRRT
jgi:plasmid stabilization system protein ParE